jgi:hypothetical protein
MTKTQSAAKTRVPHAHQKTSVNIQNHAIQIHANLSVELRHIQCAEQTRIDPLVQTVSDKIRIMLCEP